MDNPFIVLSTIAKLNATTTSIFLECVHTVSLPVNLVRLVTFKQGSALSSSAHLPSRWRRGISLSLFTPLLYSYSTSSFIYLIMCPTACQFRCCRLKHFPIGTVPAGRLAPTVVSIASRSLEPASTLVFPDDVRLSRIFRTPALPDSSLITG